MNKTKNFKIRVDYILQSVQSLMITKYAGFSRNVLHVLSVMVVERYLFGLVSLTHAHLKVLD